MKNIVIFAIALFGSLSADEMKILAICGSTREESFNKKLLMEAVEIAREKGAQVTVVNLKDLHLPFYDGDLERTEGLPSGAKQLRALMIQSNAILIAAPEYNHSLSAVLKNAIDWASRSEEGRGSKEAFKGKKFAIMSASPGKLGGARGLAHLREILEDVNGIVVEKKVSIGQAHEAFGSDGKLIKANTLQALKEEINQLF